MNELVIGDKRYISSKRAAELTGYAKDYIGQLCREGYVEAKMVGRSWYVLESSIREHRFGKDEKVGEDATPAPVSETSRAWTPPTYVPETPAEIPVLRQTTVRQEEVRETAQSIDVSTTETTITEMQAAWKEWFETRNDVPEAHNDEEADEETEAYEPVEEETAEEDLEEDEEADDSVAIPVHKVREPKQSDIVPVRRPVVLQEEAPAPRIISERRVRPLKADREKAGTSLVAKAFLVALAGLVITTGIIGSGFADSYINNNPVIQYLGGESTIHK